MKCYCDKAKLMGFLGLSILMVGACYFCTTLPDDSTRFVGWLGVAFFGLAFVVIPVMWLRKGPQVIIDDRGLEDCRLKIGLIPWEDIGSLSIESLYSSRRLSVELTDSKKYFSRMPLWKRWSANAGRGLGFSRLTVSFSGLSPGLDEVWSYLKDQEIIPSQERST
jgi:hypothetical protein